MGLNSLAFLSLAGVKWELNEAPNIPSQTASPEIPQTSAVTQQTPHVSVIPAVAPITATDAINSAGVANDLDTLRTAIAKFEHPLRQFVKNTALPHFTRSAPLLIVTDMPSGDDDETGEILTGGAGELFDKMLSAIGMQRNDVSVVPLVFWRTPGGRSPSRSELDLARPFVMRAIDLLQPQAILTLGTLPAEELAGIKLTKTHGVPSSIINHTSSIPVMPIYHPNYLMLKPDAKRDVWLALQNLQNLLKTAE